MSLADERPTAGLIAETVAALEPTWLPVRADMRVADSYHAGTWAVWDMVRFPKRPAVHPPFAKAKIDQAVNTQISLNPKVSKDPSGSRNQAAVELANQAEVGLVEVLKGAFRKEPVPSPKTFFRYLVQYGVAVIGAEWDEQELGTPPRKVLETQGEYDKRAAGWEKDKPGWNPVRVRVPHPARVLCPPYEARPSCVIIQGRRYAGDLYDLTKRKKRYKGKVVTSYDIVGKPYELVDTVEWISAHYHALMVKGGDVLFVDTPFYGFQSYQLLYSGWGIETADMMGQEGPQSLANGLLHGVWEEINNYAQTLSALHNYMVESGYPRVTAKDAVQAAAQLANPEGIMEGEPGDFGFLQFPEVRQAVFQDLEAIERRLEQVTFTGAVSGEKISGVDTVGQQMMLQTAQQRKFAVPLDQVRNAFSELGSDILKMVDMRGVTLRVRGKELSPENIDGNYDVLVQFPQVDPLIQQAKQREGREEIKLGALSIRTHQESDLLIDNTTEERDRLLDQEIDSNPAVHQHLIDQRMRARGMREIADKLRAEREALAAQGQGQEVRPPVAQPMNGQRGMP